MQLHDGPPKRCNEAANSWEDYELDNTFRQTATRLGMTLTTALLLATPAAATKGMFALGFSTNQRAMGGAGVAYGYEAMSATQNPALAASVGHQFHWV